MASEKCDDCGTELTLRGCGQCGAPVCCPKCCREQAMADLKQENADLRGINKGLLKNIQGKVARVAELESERDKLAKWIRNHPGAPDHACDQCSPGGAMTGRGFVCAQHLAKERRDGE